MTWWLPLLAATILFSSEARAQPVKPHVESVFPHDAKAFTQGLLLFEGKFYESTGLNGQSTLRRVAPATGVVEKTISLDQAFFGEGLERVDRQLIQLTWQSGIAIVYNIDDFAELRRYTYTGEGWGLCFDGTDLVMSDGSDQLFFRDPSTFSVRRQVTVRRGATSVTNLNELECVGSLVYANVWQTDTIVRVDKSTGTVLTDIDASGLLTSQEAQNANVLNGIVYDPATRHFYLTGKLWPKLFEVSFDFDPGGADAGTNGSSDAGDDAPPVFDAGRAPDASVARDARTDSTTSIDAPVVRPEGGTADVSGPPVDGATPSEAGRPDVNSSPDAATTGGNPAVATAKGGCGCRAARGTSRDPWLALAVLAGLAALSRARRAGAR